MKDKKMFGSFIKQKRLEKNYSQKDLAELLFVTESAVSKWERGVTYPDITLIKDICKVLDITEHELIESSNDLEYRKMKKDAKKFNKIKKILFWTLNILYLIAIITCFIVNLVTNHTLSWFFIVLAAILVAYTICPTLMWIYSKFKLPIFISSTWLSLFLLFLTCSIYTNNYWFMIASIGVLLSYFIIFYPILFTKQKRYLNNEKYQKLSKYFLLTYLIGMLLIICLLLLTIYIYNEFDLLFGITISICCFILPIGIGILKILNISKLTYKIIGCSILGLFVILSIIIVSFSIKLGLSTGVKNYNIKEINNEIKIDANIANINIKLTTDNKNIITYDENKKIYFEIKEIEGVLSIKQIDKRSFFEKLFNYKKISINLFLSNTKYNFLNIDGKTVNIKIDEGFIFENVKIKNSTGNIKFTSDVNSNLEIENKTGNIIINNTNVKGKIDIYSKTGDVKLKDITGNELDIEISTGKTKLQNTLFLNDINITGKTGDVILDKIDALNIYITISTGNVEGTILTDKIYNVHSSTGYINVPDTTTGGICKIKTSTGNISIH